jgi:hypothetical protein
MTRGGILTGFNEFIVFNGIYTNLKLLICHLFLGALSVLVFFSVKKSA